MVRDPESNGPLLGHGILAGLIAAVVFGGGQIVAALIMGQPALMPIRLFASLPLGEQALTPGAWPLAGVVASGVLAHLVVSVAFAMLYALVLAPASKPVRTSWGIEGILGVSFGFLVWAFNFQIVARAWFPWFLDTPQLLQALMHGILWGIPLAVSFAALERWRYSEVEIPV